IYQDGMQTRDFTCVGDIARANLLAMEEERADGRVFNVGRGEAVSVIELMNQVASAYGLKPAYTMPGEFRPGDVRHLVHDATSIRELGWKPETTLQDGLAEVADWIRGQDAVEEYYSDALEILRKTGVVRSARTPA